MIHLNPADPQASRQRRLKGALDFSLGYKGRAIMVRLDSQALYGLAELAHAPEQSGKEVAS
ncbi:hypothetical protein [Rhodophyticola porphyridii]|uniref:hypothetical protein n=1 Tax=Rhodophyticola porphyridii TaxID=1852017 RepID=UPI0035CFF0EC